MPIRIITHYNFTELMGKQLYDVGVALIGLDILMAANSGFYLKGYYKSDRWEVLQNYLKTSFLYDFGVFLLLLLERDMLWDYVLILFFYKLKPYSLMVKRIEESFYFNIKIIHYLRLAKLLFFVIFVSHIFACMWVFIAEGYEDEETWRQKVPYIDMEDWQMQVMGVRG